MRHWSWHGAVALVLAVCVGVGWATALIIAAAESDPIGDQGAALLTTIGGALVGGVVGWLGARAGFDIGRDRGRRDRPEDRPTDDGQDVADDSTTTEREAP